MKQVVDLASNQPLLPIPVDSPLGDHRLWLGFHTSCDLFDCCREVGKAVQQRYGEDQTRTVGQPLCSSYSERELCEALCLSTVQV